MTLQPVFTEDCLEASAARADRPAALVLLNTRLHPALQAIVAAEVASGKRVVDVGTDWPDPGSVHVTLRPCNDPHYWHADYSTANTPRHLLIC